MFAISFDMVTATLKTEYGEPDNQAYDKIALELERFNFGKVYGSFFVSDVAMNGLVNAWDAVDHLAGINNIIPFEAEAVDEVEPNFHAIVDECLEFCEYIGKKPEVGRAVR